MCTYSETTGTAKIKCPFFIGHDDHRIVCEGLLPGSRISNKFKRAGSKDRAENNLCAGDYARCPLCQAIMRFKYDE